MFVSDRKLSKWECFLTLAPIFYNGTSKCGLSETDVRQQGEAEFDEYKKRSESTRSVKRNHCGATNRRIQNALENVTFAIPDTTGWSRRIDLRLTFDLIDIESGMIVKLPWVNLTSPKAGKQQIEKIEIMQYSKSQCVGKCFAHWCNGYVMHNWNSNRRNMEEGETRGASRSKRKYRKATPKKVNTVQQCRCMTPDPSPKSGD